MDDFLGRDPQLLGSIAGTIQRWTRGAPAKVTARRWGVDPKTAENVSQGVVSSRTLEKAVQAEGWPLLLALGEAVTGKTFDEWISDELEKARAGAAELEARAERAQAARRRLSGRPDVVRSFAPMARSRRREDRDLGCLPDREA